MQQQQKKTYKMYLKQKANLTKYISKENKQRRFYKMSCKPEQKTEAAPTVVKRIWNNYVKNMIVLK